MVTVSSDQMRDVADNILTSASHTGLRNGNRLPTERELAQALRLSRTTIRNAMALLESEGVVSREVGRGTFLRRDPDAVLGIDAVRGDSSVVGNVSPADVMSARLLIEPAALAATVENATASDFEEIERCLAGCDDAADFDEFERWDLALHQAFVRASHNPLIENMYHFIAEARLSVSWGSLKRRSDSPERRAHYSSQHREIARALSNRDGRAAREAMVRHLGAVELNLQRAAQS
jgi:GntR family transcriptional regulator, uxu operon transcriptional repressor